MYDLAEVEISDRERAIIRLIIDEHWLSLEMEKTGSSLQSPVTLKVIAIPRVLVHLRHEPATAYELEAAIAEIEDQLMPVIRLLPTHSHLVSSAAAVRAIAKVAGFNDVDKVILDIETVERLFNHLAEVSYGTPAARFGLPISTMFTTNLLMLRELLHHAGFTHIMVEALA